MRKSSRLQIKRLSITKWILSVSVFVLVIPSWGKDITSDSSRARPFPADLVRKMNSLEKRIQRTLTEENDLKNRADFTTSQVEQMDRELSQTQDERKKWQRHLVQTFLFRRALQAPQSESLSNLLSRPSQLDRITWFVRRLSQNAIYEIQNAHERSKELEALKLKKENYSKSLEILIEKMAKQQEGLRAQLKAQERLYAQIRAAFEKKPKIFQKMITDLESNGIDTSSLRRSEAESVWKKRGTLSWPLAGTLLSQWGMSLDSHEFVTLPRRGVFIEAGLDAHVRAPLKGKIVYAESSPDLGQTVFIDHGDQIWSVIAGLKAINAKPGEVVEKEQILGIADVSLYHKKEGIYFELRHYGHPLAVRDWLVPSTTQTGSRHQ